MKFVLLCTLVLSMNVNAYNLQEILETLKTNNKTKSIEAKRDAEVAQNALVSTYKAPVLGVSLSHAEDPIQEGTEYSIGISQDIENPFSLNAKELANMKLSQAAKQEAKHKIHLIELDIASRYYASCSAKELQTESQNLFIEQSKRVNQLQNAYNLGEISKREYLFNKLDLAKLHKSANVYKRLSLEEFNSLQTSVGAFVIDKISCSDLLQPKREIVLRDISEHGELKRLAYQKDASKSLYEVYDSSFEAIGYELMYEKELETKRYTVGLSIPLGGISSEREMLREQELSMSSSYEFEKYALENEIKNGSKKLLSKLEVLFDELELLKNEILPLNTELLKLAKSAQREGEGTIMEYLDASRSYSENVLDMLEIKKTYYYELFELYKIADMEYGEEK